MAQTSDDSISTWQMKTFPDFSFSPSFRLRSVDTERVRNPTENRE